MNSIPLTHGNIGITVINTRYFCIDPEKKSCLDISHGTSFKYLDLKFLHLFEYLLPFQN